MIYAAIEPSGTYPRDVRPIGQTELAIQLKLSRFAQTDSFVNLANLPTVAARSSDRQPAQRGRAALLAPRIKFSKLTSSGG